jgi:hypothetical protein
MRVNTTGVRIDCSLCGGTNSLAEAKTFRHHNINGPIRAEDKLFVQVYELLRLLTRRASPASK